MAFTAIATEGVLFPADLLERLAVGDETSGQRPEDFGLKSGKRLSDEMQAAFSDIRAQWEAYQRRLTYSKESATTLTRGSWVIPLLERLGFTLEFQRRAATAGADTFDFSHRAGVDPEAPPVHVVAHDQKLDHRGEARRSPHALVQEYLNRTDALWGLVTNGDKLRLLRDSARLARPTYVEFDLRALVTDNLYSEFVLLYRLLHRTRFPQGAADAHECRLEKYYQQGLDEGGRVREHLREGVEVALQELGTAFLAHSESQALRQAIQVGRLLPEDYYRQLLRLVYRLLFLMVAEERRLLFPPEAPHSGRQEIYSRYYSVDRLRQRCERRFAGDRFSDLWVGLIQTFRLFQSEAAARQLGLAPLDGELFGPLACPDLEGAACENARLLRALYHLSTFTDGGVRRRVNYAGLDTEELGSIYESLLEYHPQVEFEEQPRFEMVWGSERKQTGSFYTPPELVRELIDSALVPVMEERLAPARTREEKEAALRGLKICDPACGSGHFLLAAARRLGQELARVRTGEMEPAPEAYREAVRDIIRECLYAVDKNPLAVDLCKVALWMEGHCVGLPLSFLDHHVKCGDSLVGVMDLAVLKDGIPDDAYKPVTGDDRQAASQYKRRNQEERDRQSSLFQEQLAQAADGPRALAPDFAALAGLAELTPQDVQTKAEMYAALRQGSTWHQLLVTCDLWTSSFFSHLLPPSSGQTPLTATTATVWGYLTQPGAVHGQVVGKARELSAVNRFFHWPLEFPEVFAAGGFDVVLGNPPWERIKLQEQEFFAGRDRAIAQAPNRAARERLIRRLLETNPTLAAEFALAKHQAEAQSKFVRSGIRFPLCGRGDINTYAVFAEVMRNLMGPQGRVGIIVPSGIATDDTTKFFFQDLMDTRSLASLFDFENRQKIFPGIDSRIKFCLLTLTGAARPQGVGAEFAFFLHQVVDLKDADRRFVLSRDDIALLNPNTRTCPIFRSLRDAEITKAIYQRVPVLIKEGSPGENPWGIKFSTMFHMSNDSHLFRTRSQLEAEGWQLSGNIFRKTSVGADPCVRPLPAPASDQGAHMGAPLQRPSEHPGPDPVAASSTVKTQIPLNPPLPKGDFEPPFEKGGQGGFASLPEEAYLPLYEAKMMHHFDHRWATYEGTDTRDVTQTEKGDPDFLALPRYWVDEAEVKRRVPRRPEMLASALEVPEKSRRQIVSKTFCYWAAGYWRKMGNEAKAEKLLAAAVPSYITDTQVDVFNKWAHGRQCEQMQEWFPLTEADVNRMSQAILSDPIPLAEELVERFTPRWLLGWRDIARSTDERTVIAGVLPWGGVGNNLPLMILGQHGADLAAGLAANLAAFCYDFVARQNVGGTHLNYFIYKQLPVLPPSTYDRPTPWTPGETLQNWLACQGPGTHLYRP